MTELNLQNVIHQEKQEKPTLNASPGLGAWLIEQGGSLAFTTYQSARLFFLSGRDDGQTQAQERILGTAMGLAVEDRQIWVSNQQQLWRFAGHRLHQHPRQPVGIDQRRPSVGYALRTSKDAPIAKVVKGTRCVPYVFRRWVGWADVRKPIAQTAWAALALSPSYA